MRALLRDGPADYATNPFGYSLKFFRDHQCARLPRIQRASYVSCEEINKALKLKAAFSTALDQYYGEAPRGHVMLEYEDIQHILLARASTYRAIRIPFVSQRRVRTYLAVRGP